MRDRLVRTGWLLSILILISTIDASSQLPPPHSSVPLIQALRRDDLHTAQEILHSGVKLDVVDNNGETPLIVAIELGYIEFAEALLTAGAGADFPDGAIPLNGAARLGYLGLAKQLLAHGAAVNAANAKGETALMEAPRNGSDGKMTKLLLDMGADPNAQSAKHFTALINTAFEGDDVAAEMLIKAGADPTVKDVYGHTAEDEACDRGERGRARVCKIVRGALAERLSKQ